MTPSLFGSSPTSTSAPALTSATTASGDVGSVFGYQITATNAPASYGATGLPAGLSVNALTGFISGKVATAGTYPFTVTATNAFGSGSRSVTLTLATNLADALDQPSLAWSLDLSKPWTRVAGPRRRLTMAWMPRVAPRSGTMAAPAFRSSRAARRSSAYGGRCRRKCASTFLHFDLDGTDQAAISGTVDWQQRGFIIPAGSHLLSWTYDQDVSTSAGSDAGRVAPCSPFPPPMPISPAPWTHRVCSG